MNIDWQLALVLNQKLCSAACSLWAKKFRIFDSNSNGELLNFYEFDEWICYSKYKILLAHRDVLSAASTNMHS